MPVAATPGPLHTAASIVDLIGNTPLLRLSKFEADLRGVELYAKAEWRNPGGSVKDRPAARMIADGERSGALTPDKILLDATSGNTGIAYAMIGAAKGYRVRLCVPANVTPERKRILKAFGAEIIFTDPMEGSDGAIVRAREMYAEQPETYFYPDQYSNPSNWRAHYDTTGPEILDQTGGRLTHFVAGLGTSGTFMGIGRRLR
jgi:cysteine synthase B